MLTIHPNSIGYTHTLAHLASKAFEMNICSSFTPIFLLSPDQRHWLAGALYDTRVILVHTVRLHIPTWHISIGEIELGAVDRARV